MSRTILLRAIGILCVIVPNIIRVTDFIDYDPTILVYSICVGIGITFMITAMVIDERARKKEVTTKA